MSEFLLNRERYEESLTYMEKALNVYKEILGETSVYTINAANLYGRILFLLNKDELGE